MKNHAQMNTSLPSLGRLLIQAQYHRILVKCKSDTGLLRLFRAQYHGILSLLADFSVTTRPKAINQVIISALMTDTPMSKFASVLTKGWMAAANGGKNSLEVDSLRFVQSLMCWDSFLMQNCTKNKCILRHVCPCDKDHNATNCPAFPLSDGNSRSLKQNLAFNKLFLSLFL